MRPSSFVIGIIAALLPVAAFAQADDPMSLQGDDGQWVLPGKNYSATRFSTLNKITPENVSKLKVAWSMSTGTNQGHEGAPLVVGSTMYIHSSFHNHVFAVDLTKNGSIIWKYTPKQDTKATPVASFGKPVVVNDGFSITIVTKLAPASTSRRASNARCP